MFLACISSTDEAMDKLMAQLDSAGQKGPEITLGGILIVVRGSPQRRMA